MVKRFKKVKVKALNRKGEKVMLTATGLESVIFQHEIDHLDGVLFIDKVERLLKIEGM
jgi:peptide deformylase